MITEEAIQKRITELKTNQEQLVAEANRQLAGIATAIAELERLIEPPQEQEEGE